MAEALNVKVALFGHLAEAAGRSSLSLMLTGSSPSDLLHAVQRALPALPLDGVRVAVNDAYASKTTRIKTGDDLCLIPPVGGG